jgi:hypothetical protein
MYQCCLCWEYCKHYNENCPWCGAEAVVMVEVEDWMTNRISYGEPLEDPLNKSWHIHGFV